MRATKWSARLSVDAARGFGTKAPRGTSRLSGRSSSSRHVAPPPRSGARRAYPARTNSAQTSQQPGTSPSTIPSQRHTAGPDGQVEPAPPAEQPSKVALVSSALAENESSDLVAPVHIPDDPDGVLRKDHPAMAILNNSSVVIQRQIEMMNVFLGFEQANKYVIMNARGGTIGYLAEQDHGIGQAMVRQMAKTHRSFTAHIFDKDEREVLRIHRPFAWINSHIRIYDPMTGTTHDSEPSTALQGLSTSSVANAQAATQTSSIPLSDMRIIGESSQQWAPLRRKYNLFTYRTLDRPGDPSGPARLTSGDAPNTSSTALQVSSTPEQAIEAGMAQFAHVNEPFLSWDFTLKDGGLQTIGSVNRSFGGFAREIFTDTGVYALRMDAASLALEPPHYVSQTAAAAGEVEHSSSRALTLDQRAVMLATAVSIDFDYFSRHSGAGHGGFMPLWFPWWGGGAAAEGGAGAAGAGAVGAAEGAGAVGAAEGAAGGIAGTAARGVGGAGAGEGAIAGAGTMAGYEAMNRGRQGQAAQQDDASPTNNDPYGDAPQQQQPGQQEQVWGEQTPDGADWWNPGSGAGQSGGGGQGGGAGGGGGGDGGGGGGGEGGGGGLGDWLSDFFDS